MKAGTKKYLKHGLAAVGVAYLLGGVAYLAYTGMRGSGATGPSDLAAHPERAEEIMAQRRAEELKDQLGLSDEQTQQITELFNRQRMDGPPGEGDPRQRWQGMRDEMAKILTEEQQAKMQQMRGPGRGGPGGPGGFMSPEKVESLKSKMSPEQQERFEKKMQEWAQRRSQWGGRRGGQGGDRGAGGAGPGRQ